jgi:hypothetical protein
MLEKLTRPQIKLHASRLPQNLDEAEDALVKAEAPVYQMKGSLVQIVRLDNQQVDADHGIRRDPGALAMRLIRPQRIVELMLTVADFYRYNERAGAWLPSAPTATFANALEARGEWKLRVLRGIIEAPTLRPDGSVLDRQGYDPATQVYLDTGGVEFPAIPDAPTREQALEALDLLKDVIKDFPFVPDEDGKVGDPCPARSVALSAMLTGVCRKGLRTAPAHAIDATSMATGKTLLCDVISMLATGRSAAAISQGQTREEFNKRLFSVLLQGDPVVVIDNIDQEVASDEFCSVLTAPEWQNRVLGESETRTVPTNVLFLPNGNNIRFAGDMITRVIACRMDAGIEDPGSRKFDRDLRLYVPENRPRLVAAALTVLRAFIVAGRPGLEKLTPFARFEDWSNLVRGALIWLGEPDPLITRDAVVAIDPERENLAGLLLAWEKAIGFDRWVTAKEVIEASDGGRHELAPGSAADLATALDAITPHHEITPIALGKYLVRFDGRIVDGVCIRKHVVNGKSTKFRLEDEL